MNGLRVAAVLCLGVVLAGCPAKKCDATSCAAGCCDASGTCVSGTQSACGTAGALCTACPLAQVCQAGLCVPGGGGGGSGGSGGGGGGGGSGGGGGFLGGGAGGGTADALSVYRAIADEFCAYSARCGGTAGLAGVSVAECAEYYFAYFTTRAVPTAAVWQNITLPTGAACLALIRSLQCGDTANGDACAGISLLFEGRVATGGVCLASSIECANKQDSCVATTCPRRCQAVPTGGNGQPCRRDAPLCNSGLFCSDGLTCEALRPAGAACTSGMECQNAACESGRCATLPAAGSLCRSTYPQCATGAYCSGGSCVATKGLDATCFSLTECTAPLSCISGRCAVAAGVGARCSSYSECGTTLYCDSILRTCQEYSTADAGAACTDMSRQCRYPDACLGDRENPDGGVGQLGRCGTPQVGATCDSDSECPEHSSCVTGRCVLAMVGSPCGSSNFRCLAADYCSASSTCAPRFNTNAQCDAQRTDSCLVPNDRCVQSVTDGLLRCLPPVAPGGACADDSVCSPFDRCINRVCVKGGHLGEPCIGTTCFEGACNGDAGCGPARGVDAGCTVYTECASGICVRGVCAAATCQ